MTQVNIKLTTEQIAALGKSLAAPKKRKRMQPGLTLNQYLGLIGFDATRGMRVHIGHMLNRYARAKGYEMKDTYANVKVYPVKLLQDFIREVEV